jgi:hypothetical protein
MKNPKTMDPCPLCGRKRTRLTKSSRHAARVEVAGIHKASSASADPLDGESCDDKTATDLAEALCSAPVPESD